MLGRAFNRPRLDDLKEKMVSNAERKADVEGASRRAAALYDELAKRIRREKELRIVHQKLFIKKQLLDTKGKETKPKKVKKGKMDRAPVYKWIQERKR